MFGDHDRAAHAGPSSTPANAQAGAQQGGGTTFNVAEYWRLATKHKFLIAGTTLAFLLIAVAVTLLMTPIYTASATLQIDRESARVLNVDEVQPQEAMIQGEEFFQTQYGLLRSRSLADRVVDKLGLATSDTFLEAMGEEPPGRDGGTAVQQSAARREEVIRVLRENMAVSPVRGSRLVALSFNSPDPALSARVANTFAEEFIQSNLDRKYESSAYAREFLENLIAETKVRLEDAERQLTAYASNQQIINIREPNSPNEEAQSIVSADLSSLNTALGSARASRIAAEQRWEQASRAPLMTLPEVLSNQAIQTLTQTRAQVDAEYQQKLQTYQPNFPEMVELRARRTELDNQIRTIATGIRDSIRGQQIVAQNQERALAGEVAGLKVDILDLRNRSIQYNILQRELDTSRTLYDGLLQRYKEVGVTGGVTSNNISVVDSATVPEKPSGPRLLVNLAIALLVGLGIGVIITKDSPEYQISDVPFLAANCARKRDSIRTGCPPVALG